MIKYIYILTLIIITNFNAKCQNTNYDSTLAKSLGSDDYGMKMYTLVILKTGSNTQEPQASKDSLFNGHMSNMKKLVDMNKLIIAGPFGKNESDFRGLFILNVSDFEEANKLLETDPAIKAQLLKPELYKWYGSAALPIYLNSVDKITKKKI
jgi:uncharacterized protein YciI